MQPLVPASATLGVWGGLRDAALSPLRQLSFWKMKDRARRFGESGGHDLLSRLQRTAPTARFHPMGHSFGCITVSSAVGGAVDAPPLPRPIDSLFLVQGALSLWSFAAEIPYAKGKAGYFNRIIADRRVSGPIITTRSAYDTAIGRDDPLGAYLKKQLLLDQRFPAYGGIGAFGVRGLPVAPDMPIQSVGFQYDFRGARIYNLEASRVIRNGSGASGAHNDIAHPEVTHAFWAAVLCAMAPRSGGLLSPSQQRQQQQPQQHATAAAASTAAAAAATAAAATATTATTAAAAAATAAAATAAAVRAAATAHRWINAEIEDQCTRRGTSTRPSGMLWRSSRRCHAA